MRALTHSFHDIRNSKIYIHTYIHTWMTQTNRMAGNVSAEREKADVLRALAKTLQCHYCHIGLPNAHLLDLHISESHDNFFQAQVDRGSPVYQCLVEFCGERFSSVEERRLHLEHVHRFCPSLMGLSRGIGLDMMHRPVIKKQYGKKSVDRLACDVQTGLKIDSHRPPSIPFGRRKGKGI